MRVLLTGVLALALSVGPIAVLTDPTQPPMAAAFSGTSSATPASFPDVELSVKVADESVLTGNSFTVVATVKLTDANDDRPVPPGTVWVYGEDDRQGIGNGRVAVDKADPSAMSARITINEMDSPVGQLSAGMHQLRAVFTPDGSLGWQGSAENGTTVTVAFSDYRPPKTPGSQPFFRDILWLSSQGVTGGYEDGGFHPTTPISRQAMAAFLYRVANPGVAPEPCTSAPFSDVLASSPFCPQINWLVLHSIATGYSDGKFHPTAAVSRQAMASFLQRVEALRHTAANSAPNCTQAPFPDVLVGSQFCTAITWLDGRGITTGYADGNFHPGANVTRQAMAAFLHRLFGAALFTPKSDTVLVTAGAASITGNPTSGQTATLTSQAPPIHTGQFLVIDPDTSAPGGLLGKVTSVVHNSDGTTTATTETATVDQVFAAYSVVSSMSIKDPAVTIDAPPAAQMGAKGHFTLPISAFNCTGPVDPDTALTVDISDFRLDTEFSLASNKYRYSTQAYYTSRVTAALEFGASATCTLADPDAITVRFPIGGGLIGEVRPNIDLNLEGPVDLSVTTSAAVTVGLDARSDAAKQNSGIEPQLTADVDVATGLSLFAGATLDVKLFGVKGLGGSLGPALEASRKVANGCLALDLGLTVDLNLSLDQWITSWATGQNGRTFGHEVNLGYWCQAGEVPDPAITSTSLPTGTVGHSYLATLTTADNRPGTWSIHGTLPAGIILSGDTLTGIPTAESDDVIRIRFDDGNTQATITVQLVVKAPQLNGTVWAWGRNSHGQLGNALGHQYGNVPVQVSTLTNAAKISTNGDTTYAITKAGAVWAWGDNSVGQLGNGTTGGNSNKPVRVTGLTNVAQVVTKGRTAYVLTKAGAVWAWGDNSVGQLGNSTTGGNSNKPVRVTGLTNIAQISSNFQSAYAITTGGAVWAWGDNSVGQLGNGTTWSNSNKPVRVTGLTNITSISTEVSTTYAVTNGGAIWAWGSNFYSQLGTGSTDSHSYVPALVTGITNIIGVFTDGATSYAVTKGGAVWGWGDNYNGQLGNATPGSDSKVPVRITGPANVTHIASGHGAAYALTSSGNVWMWGDRAMGRPGGGTRVPALIAGLTEVTDIITHEGAVYALTNGGAVWSWGINLFGTLGIGSDIGYSTVPVHVAGLARIAQITSKGSAAYALVGTNLPQ